MCEGGSTEGSCSAVFQIKEMGRERDEKGSRRTHELGTKETATVLGNGSMGKC